MYWSLTFKPSALPCGLTGLADIAFGTSEQPMVATWNTFWRRLRQVEFDFSTTLLHSIDFAHQLDIY